MPKKTVDKSDSDKARVCRSRVEEKKWYTVTLRGEERNTSVEWDGRTELDAWQNYVSDTGGIPGKKFRDYIVEESTVDKSRALRILKMLENGGDDEWALISLGAFQAAAISGSVTAEQSRNISAVIDTPEGREIILNALRRLAQ